MRRGACLLLLLVASRAAAWDSRCYLAVPVSGRSECAPGPETARNRWLGPSDEHRALLELGRIFGGLPHAVSGDTPLTVFTGDAPVDVSGQSLPSLQPVNFAETKRAQDRPMSVPELAQLPDHAYALWDWALGDETCPVDPNVPALDCHDFAKHMGPVNSNHFVPQSGSFYAYYHRLALDRAADCTRMSMRLGGDAARFTDFVVACEREALMIESIGQHFLQDAWAAGHMWERWGSPDPADFPTLTDALLVAMTSGLIHGARAVLETIPDLLPDIIASQITGYHFDDPLNAPEPAVGFRSPTDMATHAALGDLYLTDLLAQQGANFPETYARLFSCEAAGLRAVYAAAGAPEGALGPLAAGLVDVDPTSDACFGQRVTNQAMEEGIGLDFSLPDGTPVRIEIDSAVATHLVPLLSQQAGGNPTPAQTTQYQVDMAQIVAIARLTAMAAPDGVELASGVLPPLLGIQANGHYVKSPLAPYVDPPLPWPASGAGGTDTDRALALARTFHRAHAIDWCNRFSDGSPDLLDVTALQARVDAARQAGAAPEEIDAACAVCEEFGARHLRVGHDETDYDTTREPLCHFLADDPDATQYVFEPGDPSDALPALAAKYCGCGGSVTIDSYTVTIAGGTFAQCIGHTGEDNQFQNDDPPAAMGSGPFDVTLASNPAPVMTSCAAGTGSDETSGIVTSSGSIAASTGALTLMESSQGMTTTQTAFTGDPQLDSCLDVGDGVNSRTKVDLTVTGSLSFAFSGTISGTQTSRASYSLVRLSPTSTTIFDVGQGLTPSVSGSLLAGQYEYTTSAVVSNDLACQLTDTLSDTFAYDFTLIVHP